MRGAFQKEFESGFIAESLEKLNHILQYYEALLGLRSFPPTVCNAPMVSTVITSAGDLLPCFFLPGFSNVRNGELGNLLNGAGIRSTREEVRHGLLDRCKTCVCTLQVSPAAAFAGRF
jgi:MoaA/NifB/PqqE/SkfB family radical SAM enzyme